MFVHLTMRPVVGAMLAVPPIVAAAMVLSPTHRVVHADYRLVDDALVIIPVDNPEYAQAATNLYLDPSGFDGTSADVSTLDMPEVVSGGTLNDAVNYGVNELVSAIETDYQAGDMATGPLYVFGYSQSSVVMGMAEQQLAAYDNGAITPDDLHFVMVGDSASAEGGFLNSFLDEFPASWQPYIVDAFKAFGADEVLGQVTPDNYYPTDVYSLSGDGWAIYDNGLNNAGLFSDHLEYLGLTSQEIASATATTVGETTYHVIQDSMVNSLEALWTQLQIADSVLF